MPPRRPQKLLFASLGGGNVIFMKKGSAREEFTRKVAVV
jgi:hypothetical protein